MFAVVPILFGLLLFPEATLPSGIHVAELPAAGDRFEVVAGYRAAVRNETSGKSGLAAVVAQFLRASSSARQIALTVYSAGGDIEFFSELDVTGFRLNVPLWAKPMVEGSLAAFFEEAPAKDSVALERALYLVRKAANDLKGDFGARVEDEIRIGLLGSRPYHHPPGGWAVDLEGLSVMDIQAFFVDNYGTDQAFVLQTGAPTASLSELTRRISRNIKPASNFNLKAQRALVFSDQEVEGKVIFATPSATVFYRDWYAILLLDRLMRLVIPGNPSSELRPTIDPYYYRLEVPVPPGQFADQTQAVLMQELERLQFVRATNQELEQARRDAISYLESEPITRWFLSLGLPDRREEGLQWVRSFSADDMRVTARDMLLANRVLASWSQKPRQVRVEAISLDAASATTALVAERLPALQPVRTAPFPSHVDPVAAEPAVELLPSGISIAAGAVHAIFVAPNSLEVFDAEPPAVVRDAYASYRANRILVFAPRNAMDRVKAQWSIFQGNPRDIAGAEPVGKLGSSELPVLFLLKVLLERKLIEDGLWNDVLVEISAAEGARLAIKGSEIGRQRVLSWIRELAAASPSADDMTWIREAAVHRLQSAPPDLQSLIWHRNPTATIGDIRQIVGEQLRDIARLYLE